MRRTDSIFFSFFSWGLSSLALVSVLFACDGGRAKIEEPQRVIGEKGPDAERQAALRFGQEFLERLDRNEPIAALLAPSLRSAQPEASLEATFVGFRRWTGPFRHRVAHAYGFSASLPDYPPGHYFTIYYRSHFEKGNVEEKLIVSTEGEKALLAGYNQSKRILYGDITSSPPPVINEKTLYPEGQGK